MTTGSSYAFDSSTRVESSEPQTNVYTTFAEEEIGTTDVGRTTTNQQKKNKKNKLLLGGSAVLVSLVLLLAIFGVTMLSLKKSKTMGEAGTKELTEAELIGAPAGKISEANGMALASLKAKMAAFEQEVGEKKDHLALKGALIHLTLIGDQKRPDWFLNWFTLASVDFRLLELKQIGFNKLTLDNYHELVALRDTADQILENLSRMVVAENDRALIGQLQLRSIHFFNFTDMKIRWKGKKSGITATPLPRGLVKKPKKNKALEKMILRSDNVDYCLATLGKHVSAWGEKDD